MSLYLLPLELWGTRLWFLGSHQGVQRVEFTQPEASLAFSEKKPPWGDEGQRQVEDFQSGKRQEIVVPLDWSPKAVFAEKVLAEVRAIPPGDRRTYGEIAARCGSPGAARAVGRLMARNPLPILIPCHRVIGANGKLTGYSGPGGITFKKWLLEKEKSVFNKT
ncbi:MAG: MGMT family protein [Opitutales bacterium]|nr:MGMT family protein [Opitutales bacterium]